MEKVSVDYALDINYSKILGTWEKPLESLTKSNYMYNLMVFLHEAYKIGNIVPNRKDVFSPFMATRWDDLKVVIVGKEPYPNYNATGIPYANPDRPQGAVSPDLIAIQKCVEQRVYEGFNLDFDPTLQAWTNQGVMMLSTALTVEYGKPESHLLFWNRFIKSVIKTISDRKTGIIFMLWGPDAIRLSDEINGDLHHVMKFADPGTVVKMGMDWVCPHFTRANDLLTSMNGPSSKIYW